MSAPPTARDLSARAHALHEILLDIGSELRSIDAGGLRDRNRFSALLTAPEVERRLRDNPQDQDRAEAASAALRTFVEERLPTLGGDYRDQLALEVALGYGSWAGITVAERIRTLESSKGGMTRSTFIRRRQKVLGWCAQWLLNEDPAPRVTERNRVREHPHAERAGDMATQFDSEMRTLQIHVLEGLFACAAGLVVCSELSDADINIDALIPSVLSPLDTYFARACIDLVSAGHVLFTDVTFDHARTGLEWVVRLLPTGVVTELQTAYTAVLDTLPLDDDIAYGLARIRHGTAPLRPPDDLLQTWSTWTIVAEWINTEVHDDDSADAVHLLLRQLLRLAEALYSVVSSTAWVRWIIDQVTVHLQACLVRVLPTKEKWRKYSAVQRELLTTFDTLAAGRIRPALECVPDLEWPTASIYRG